MNFPSKPKISDMIHFVLGHQLSDFNIQYLQLKIKHFATNCDWTHKIQSQVDLAMYKSKAKRRRCQSQKNTKRNGLDGKKVGKTKERINKYTKCVCFFLNKRAKKGREKGRKWEKFAIINIDIVVFFTKRCYNIENSGFIIIIVVVVVSIIVFILLR